MELSACDPPGTSYPANRHSNDIWFQHCALATNDIAAAYEQLQQVCFTPISRNGRELLPGGIVAFKFRDPDGHPLELIQFPKPDHRNWGGIDHSAISIADPVRSVAFCTSRLGLAVQARQVNTGPSQDALDDLNRVTVERSASRRRSRRRMWNFSDTARLLEWEHLKPDRTISQRAG